MASEETRALADREKGNNCVGVRGGGGNAIKNWSNSGRDE